MTTETTQAHRPVFPENKLATNMPFFDGSTLLFCQSNAPTKRTIPTTGTIWKSLRQNKGLAERLKDLPRSQEVTYRAWKLAYCNWGDKIVRSISTGLPPHAAERSPTFYQEDGKVHLSFIGGGPISGGFLYRLYVCSGSDLNHLEPPQPLEKPPLFFGFVSPHHVCWGTKNVVHLSEKATGRTFRLKTSFFRVASVTFLASDPAKLLITGLIDRDYRAQTTLYDLSTGKTSDVSTGEPIYKASIFENTLIFSQKIEGSFENRVICQSNFNLTPSSIQISKEE